MFKIFKRDKLSVPVSQGVIAGIMEVAYIMLVAVFVVATDNLFASPRSGVMIFGIVCVLSLLVLSVAVSGVLVFSWPAYYFMERKYKEAVNCFIATAASIFVIFAIIFILASLATLF